MIRAKGKNKENFRVISMYQHTHLSIEHLFNFFVGGAFQVLLWHVVLSLKRLYLSPIMMQILYVVLYILVRNFQNAMKNKEKQHENFKLQTHLIVWIPKLNSNYISAYAKKFYCGYKRQRVCGVEVRRLDAPSECAGSMYDYLVISTSKLHSNLENIGFYLYDWFLAATMRILSMAA